MPCSAPPQLKHSHSTDYSTDFSGSEYEFDFEDYNEAEEQQIINQKVNLLKNIEGGWVVDGWVRACVQNSSSCGGADKQRALGDAFWGGV